MSFTVITFEVFGAFLLTLLRQLTIIWVSFLGVPFVVKDEVKITQKKSLELC